MSPAPPIDSSASIALARFSASFGNEPETKSSTLSRSPSGVLNSERPTSAILSGRSCVLSSLARPLRCLSSASRSLTSRSTATNSLAMVRSDPRSPVDVGSSKASGVMCLVPRWIYFNFLRGWQSSAKLFPGFVAACLRFNPATQKVERFGGQGHYPCVLTTSTEQGDTCGGIFRQRPFPKSAPPSHVTSARLRPLPDDHRPRRSNRP